MRVSHALIGAVVACSGVMPARAGSNRHLALEIVDFAGVPAADAAQSQHRTRSILSTAHINVTWRESKQVAEHDADVVVLLL